MLETKQKELVINKYQRSSSDTGSPEVQVALISERILSLQNHFKKHKKDFHSKTGLLRLVNQRRSFLKYLREKNSSRYLDLINKLGLRK